MNKQLIAALAAAGLVTACSGPQTITQKVFEEKEKIVKEQIDETPKWMIELPKDEEAYYSAGTAQSSDLQMSIDMATINAKRTLADRIAGDVDIRREEDGYLQSVYADATDYASGLGE